MSNKWVVNASPLILLAKVGHIDLFPKLADQIIIPESVINEINQGPPDDPAKQWLVGAGAHFGVPDPQPGQTLTAWDLGQGETNVLAWAFQNPGFEAIIDDRAARKCAFVQGIPFRARSV